MTTVRRHSEQKVFYGYGADYEEVNQLMSTGQWEVVSVTPLIPSPTCGYPSSLLVLGKKASS